MRQKSPRSAVPNLFGTRDQFRRRLIFSDWGGGGVVLRRFKCIAFTVDFISFIIMSASPQVLRHQILEREEPCSRWSDQEGCPGGSDSKESTCQAGEPGVIPGLGSSPVEAMATHSSILAWRIPRTEEPGGLQSMGLQSLGHDWETFTHFIIIFQISCPKCKIGNETA